MTNEPFNFWNGRRADDLDGLVSCISEISDDEFLSYVNNSKNDFANWIEGSLQIKDLAEKVRPLTERDIIKATILSFVESGKNEVVIGTIKTPLDDALVKEVMQKNEDFYKYSEEKRSEEKQKEEELAAAQKQPEIASANSDSASSNNKSKITLMDIPTIHMKRHSLNDLFVGIFFGIIVGVLLTLIVIQLLTLGW